MNTQNTQTSDYHNNAIDFSRLPKITAHGQSGVDKLIKAIQEQIKGLQ